MDESFHELLAGYLSSKWPDSTADFRRSACAIQMIAHLGGLPPRSSQAIGSWERGDAAPPAEYMPALMATLGITDPADVEAFRSARERVRPGRVDRPMTLADEPGGRP